MEGVPAAINAAHLNAQLLALPTFSNKKEDQYTSTEWLQKVIINKNGGGWTELQTLTYFQNALRGTAIAWYNSLASLHGTKVLTWALVKSSFEIDYRAAATNTTIITKLSDIKQQDHEDVNVYFSKSIDILNQLKENFGNNQPVVLELTAAEQEVYDGMSQGLKDIILQEYRASLTLINFNKVAGYHLIAGSKSFIRASLMQMDPVEMEDLYNIKTAALAMEKKLEEQRRSSTNGDGSTRIAAQNGVNEVNDNSLSSYDSHQVEAINDWKRRNGYKATNSTNSSTGLKCSHCNKNGHTVDKCWSKNKTNQSNGKPGNSGQNSQKKKCTYCGMTNHTEEKCFKLQKAEKALEEQKRNKNRVNEVSQPSTVSQEHCDDTGYHFSKN